MHHEPRRRDLTCLAALFVRQRPVESHASTGLAHRGDAVSQPEFEYVLGRRERPGQALTDSAYVGMGIDEARQDQPPPVVHHLGLGRRRAQVDVGERRVDGRATEVGEHLHDQSGGGLAQKQLAERLQMDPGALTRQLKVLDQLGWIERTTDARDNRLTNVSLSDAGLAIVLDIVKRLSVTPNGIVLVTGPTGSGKTTTLYSALNYVNQPETKIITVEDPVEQNLDGLNQAQVNTKQGLTFASGLRDLLSVLGVESMTIVGHSFGGGVAMQLAYQLAAENRLAHQAVTGAEE